MLLLNPAGTCGLTKQTDKQTDEQNAIINVLICSGKMQLYISLFANASNLSAQTILSTNSATTILLSYAQILQCARIKAKINIHQAIQNSLKKVSSASEDLTSVPH